MEPASGSICAARILSSVDLPAPFGPIKPSLSPSAMPSEIFSNSTREPYDFESEVQLSRIAIYSYRNASTGSSRAAFTAGHMLKNTPTTTETENPVTSAHEGTVEGSEG